MKSSTGSVSVARYFDGVAANWPRNYSGSGGMSERISWFGQGLQAETIVAPARVLDYGCGSGELAVALAGIGYQVDGCDISPRMIETARVAPGAEVVTWSLLQAEHEDALPYKAASFDAVVSSSVFEYVDHPLALLQRLGGILRPGGVLMFTVPDARHPLREAEDRWLRRMRKPLWNGVVRRLPGRLPVRIRYEYLRLSINRWPAPDWQALLAEAGLEPLKVPPCLAPLLLMTARRTA